MRISCRLLGFLFLYDITGSWRQYYAKKDSVGGWNTVGTRCELHIVRILPVLVQKITANRSIRNQKYCMVFKLPLLFLGTKYICFPFSIFVSHMTGIHEEKQKGR